MEEKQESAIHKMTSKARSLCASSSDSRLALVAEAMADALDEYESVVSNLAAAMVKK